MRKVHVGLGVAVVLTASGAAVAAAAPGSGTRGASFGSSICQETTFTAPGGYYSAGSFYSDANASATVHVNWCYSTGTITSHQVTFQTTISPSQGHLTQTTSLNASRSKLTVNVSGAFATGVINDTGIIDLAGTVDGSGATKFANDSAAGG